MPVMLHLFAIPILAAGLLATPVRAEDPAVANTYCPVTTDEPVDERYHVDYKGRTIYFCCDKCRRKFLADPLRYAASLTNSTQTGAEQPLDRGTPPKSKNWRTQVGRFHPIAVHFPVALILTAGLTELSAVLRRKPIWHEFSRFCITLGALGALVAMPLGWLAGGAPGSDILTEWHRWLGVATYFASTSSALLVRTNGPMAYRISLLASVVLVTATGHLGGLLTHGPNFMQIWK